MEQPERVGILWPVPAPVRGFRPAVLRAARTRAGQSRRALAELVGATVNDVYRWERGLVAPTPSRLDALARAVGLTPGDLANHPGMGRLAQLRVTAGLSQRELGARVGVSHMMISRLERSEAALDDVLAGRLAVALGEPVSDVRAAYEGDQSA